MNKIFLLIRDKFFEEVTEEPIDYRQNKIVKVLMISILLFILILIDLIIVGTLLGYLAEFIKLKRANVVHIQNPAEKRILRDFLLVLKN